MTLLCAALLLGIDSGALFQDANAAAQAGRLEEALERYQTLLAEDPEATGAWLNLGNTAYRSGALARAIAAFRIAEARAPRDPRVATNLERARRDVKDRLTPAAPPPALRGLFFWHYGFSAAELGWTVALGSPLFWGIALVLRSRERLPRWLLGVGALLLVAVFASWSIRQWSPRRVAVIRHDDTQVRTSTDRRADVRFVVNEGSELRWRERTSEWVRVSLPNGQQGWVHEEDVIVLRL